MAPNALEEAIDWVASFERLNATGAPPYTHGKALIAEIERLRTAVDLAFTHGYAAALDDWTPNNDPTPEFDRLFPNRSVKHPALDENDS